MVIKIGYHPNNLHLRLAALWPGAFSDFNPVFVPYSEGRDTAHKLVTGEIDIGGTGSTPPIIASENDLAVIYIAASASRPTNGAILVEKTANVNCVADLKNKLIALVDGSFHTYFLAKSLENAGFELKDIQRLDILPDRSRELLRNGEIAAWVAMAPHLEQALLSDEFRVLLHCGTTIPNRSVFWTIKNRNLSEDILDNFARELSRISGEIISDPERAAALITTGADTNERRAWTRVISERNWQIIPSTPKLLHEQQEEADILLRHGAISKNVEIFIKNSEAEIA